MRQVIVDRAERVNNEMGGVITGVVISSGLGDAHAASMSFGESGVISLNENVWKTREDYHAWQVSGKASDLYSSNPEDMIAHEGAHILDRKLDSESSEWSDTRITTWNNFMTGQDYDNPTISRYAMYNEREMVAEAYVMYRNGGGEKLRSAGLDKIVDMFDKKTKRP